MNNEIAKIMMNFKKKIQKQMSKTIDIHKIEMFMKISANFDVCNQIVLRKLFRGA